MTIILSRCTAKATNNDIKSSEIHPNLHYPKFQQARTSILAQSLQTVTYNCTQFDKTVTYICTEIANEPIMLLSDHQWPMSDCEH